MTWDDIRQTYPDQWLILEVLASHDRDGVIFPDRLAVIERCPDGATVMAQYTSLLAELPERFLCFAHTSHGTLEFEELIWAGVRLGPRA